MKDKTHHLKERFPDDETTIDSLMVKDPGFRTICEDYDVCINALRHWSNSNEPEAGIRISEYSTLAEELEKEAAQILVVLKQRTGFQNTFK